MPLVEWPLAFPHYVALLARTPVVPVLVVVAWFAILCAGRYPRGIFDFVLGFLRWSLRVQAYAFLLAADRYPPFSFAR